MTQDKDGPPTAAAAKADDNLPVPPPWELRLPVRRGSGFLRARSSHERWTGVMRGRLALVAAAGAAVAVVAACSAPPTQATQAPQQAAAAAPAQANVPPYYVALIGSQPESGLSSSPPADAAVVRATTTGAVLARIKPPRSYTFTSVTGAADDRTFALYGTGPTIGDTVRYGTYRQRLFLLHINPAASGSAARAQLTALPEADIAGGQGRQLLAMALSPDGKSLAAIFARPSAASLYGLGELTVFNLANGTRQTWTRNVCDHGKCVEEGIGDGLPLIQYPSRAQLSWTSNSRSLLFIEGPRFAGPPPRCQRSRCRPDGR